MNIPILKVRKYTCPERYVFSFQFGGKGKIG